MIGVAPGPQRIVIGVFLFLAAVACAVAPLPLAFRSAGVLFFACVAFSIGGSQLGYLTALLAPPAGLLTGDQQWLVMLPIVLASNMLAIMGLEFAWRYWALLVAPLLQAVPQLFVQRASQQELFAVSLPWEPAPSSWILLHVLTTLAGVLVAVYLERRRERQAASV